MRILSQTFVKNNKDKCKIVYNNKLYKIKEYFEDIVKNNIYKKLIRIKLIFIHDIVDISYMFYNCDSLIAVKDNNQTNNNKNISSYFSKYLMNMNNMFFGCKSLILLPDISTWNISNVISMKNMFNGCKSLISLPDISKWDTSKVRDMSYMFYECSSLISLPDISKWNINKVRNMNLMFSESTSFISSPDFSKWNIDSIDDNDDKLEGFKFLFNFPEFYAWNILKNFVFFEMVYKRKKINKSTKIIHRDFLIAFEDYCLIIYNNKLYEAKEVFEDIDNNNNEDLIKFILCVNKKLQIFNYMFYECDSLISMSEIQFYSNIKFNEYNKQANSLVDDKKEQISPLNENNELNNGKKINLYLNIKDIDDSTVTKNENIASFTGINFTLNKFNKIIDFSYMFYKCKSLVSISDMSNWNTSQLNNIESMFRECQSLMKLPDISNWNISNVNDLSYLLHNCSSLTEIPDISKWDTSNVNDMNYMFSGCKSLISLPDISKWNTSNVNDMTALFSGCSLLIS